MKFDLKSIRALLTQPAGRMPEAPSFGQPIDSPLSERRRQNIRAPMIAGGLIIAIGVVGVGLWASFSPIWSAVVAPGVVRVEANRKVLRSQEGGIVRAVNVSDGDLVRQGQELMRFDDTLAKAQMEVLTSQHDNSLMQYARFQAEIRGARSVTVPAELLTRMSEPNVSALIQNENLIFSSRLAAIEGQAAILNQRVEQLSTGRGGLAVQVQSIDDQVALITEELDGYRTLNEKGFAPKTLILRYERQLAEIAGRRGALTADITRNSQQAGEARLQLAQLYEQRATEAATGAREAEARLAEVSPRLDAARQALAQTVVTAPDTGYILNLSQYTIGGIATPGEVLMDVVPSNAPLVITARVRPQDIDEVRAGMDAEITLNAFSTNRVPKVAAEVLTVSADALTNQETGESYFTADLRIPPSELRRLPDGVEIYPGMQATAMIRTGRRTIMSYLLGPIGDIADNSLREQ